MTDFGFRSTLNVPTGQVAFSFRRLISSAMISTSKATIFNILVLVLAFHAFVVAGLSACLVKCTNSDVANADGIGSYLGNCECNNSPLVLADTAVHVNLKREPGDDAATIPTHEVSIDMETKQAAGGVSYTRIDLRGAVVGVATVFSTIIGLAI